jgi:hypothetical protein
MFKVEGSGLRVQSPGCRVQGAGFKTLNLEPFIHTYNIYMIIYIYICMDVDA